MGRNTGRMKIYSYSSNLFFPFGLFVLIFLFFLFSPFSIPSYGEHTGIITATEVSNAFFLFPNKVVYIKTDLQSSQEESYCVDNEDIFLQLRALQKEKKTVTISYENSFWMPPWKCSRQSVIKSIN